MKRLLIHLRPHPPALPPPFTPTRAILIASVSSRSHLILPLCHETLTHAHAPTFPCLPLPPFPPPTCHPDHAGGVPVCGAAGGCSDAAGRAAGWVVLFFDDWIRLQRFMPQPQRNACAEPNACRACCHRTLTLPLPYRPQRRTALNAVPPSMPYRRAGKFGGLFASLPSPLISGLFCVMFGLIAAGKCWKRIQI